MPPICECFVALPTGAVGRCGNPARWRMSHPQSARELACCDECKEDCEAKESAFFYQTEFAPLEG